MPISTICDGTAAWLASPRSSEKTVIPSAASGT